jgi:hypothetical protein
MGVHRKTGDRTIGRARNGPYSVTNIQSLTKRLWRRHPDKEHHGLVPLRCLQEQTVLRWDTPVHRFFGPRAQDSPRR